MKTEFKQQLIEALESGNYPKGKHCLREENRFCCLGVICDISGLGEWEPCDYSPKEYRYKTDDGTDGSKYMIHGNVRDIVGIDFKTQETLSSLNDDNETFAEVIEYIKANL